MINFFKNVTLQTFSLEASTPKTQIKDAIALHSRSSQMS